ncbi:hypothetical protein niasHT_016915 [Heterodera trifolii]|uniref:MATH domain-containing protein n=1 Tax=Heterodera trifolii TaxID=157864 RepID=A0ABD2L3A6_9BILA
METFNGLDANNWLDVLKAADKYNIIGLVKKCADFPIEKLPNVFVAFEKAMLLNMEALRWADEQCRQKGIECSAEKRREMLGPALFNIRFPLIPKEEFTKSIDTIEMEIEKVSEFALEEEFLDPSKGFYNKDEDKVTLAIDVIFYEPKTEKIISDPNKSNGTLSMEIEKLSEFAREIKGSDRKSETLYIKGMPWKIWAQIETKNESNEKCLGFFLLCDASEKDGNWSRKCSATLRIVSQKNGVGNFTRKFDHVFNNNSNNWGFVDFISFAELMEPSKGLYNKDEDKVILAIDFTCE